MDIRELLTFMVKQGISDIHFKLNSPPLIRLHGQLINTNREPFPAETIRDLAYGMMANHHRTRFEEEGELDFAYSLEGVSRFRINVYRQRGSIALSVRVVPIRIKTFDELNLPAGVLNRLAGMDSGLILIAGITGAGKTTTLNAMLNSVNQNYPYNIITIEDPIEFYHTDIRSSISQREVGIDTQSYSKALKYILRQDPDVIVIGEMRDYETMSAGITAAETGHLVVSTIHTMDALSTVQRIVDAHPGPQQNTVRIALANVLRGVIVQKLIPTVDKNDRVPCHEVLIMTPYIRQLVVDGKMNEVYTAMVRGQTEGMTTFDQDLLRLYRAQKISQEAALSHSTRPENLLSMLQGISVKF